MARRTDEEIKAEIEKLESLRKRIPAKTLFGDDNVAKLDAQVEVLRDNLDEDDLSDKWGDDEDYDTYSEAQYALGWREGEEDEPPSSGWDEIARPELPSDGGAN